MNDADALLKGHQGSGAKIRRQPMNYPWAYELRVEDIGGNVLRLGSEPKKCQPVIGLICMASVGCVSLMETGGGSTEN